MSVGKGLLLKGSSISNARESEGGRFKQSLAEEPHSSLSAWNLICLAKSLNRCQNSVLLDVEFSRQFETCLTMEREEMRAACVRRDHNRNAVPILDSPMLTTLIFWGPSKVASRKEAIHFFNLPSKGYC